MGCHATLARKPPKGVGENSDNTKRNTLKPPMTTVVTLFAGAKSLLNWHDSTQKQRFMNYHCFRI